LGHLNDSSGAGGGRRKRKKEEREIWLIYIVRNVTFTEIAYFCKACYYELKAALEMLTPYSFVYTPMTEYLYQL
jgi:hypothetical protein